MAGLPIGCILFNLLGVGTVLVLRVRFHLCPQILLFLHDVLTLFVLLFQVFQVVAKLIFGARCAYLRP